MSTTPKPGMTINILIGALRQVATLAEYGTTGPPRCKSDYLTAEQATAMRGAISEIARDAITRAGFTP